MAKVAALAKMTPKSNPKGRDDYEDRRADLKGLIKSIKAVGLCQFPTVSLSEVIDGVRRTASAVHMKVEDMPCLFRPGATGPTFAEIQDQAKSHSPVQKVETWLKDPSRVTPYYQRSCQQAVGEIGEDLVRRVTEAGSNVLSMLGYARRAFLYCQPTCEHSTFLQRAVRVQWKFSDQQTLKLWLQQKRSPVELFTRIMEQRTLKCK
jgi:hypothetical protein